MAALFERTFRRKASLECIDISNGDGRSVPLAIMLLSEGYPALDCSGQRSVFLWYLAAAPSNALQAMSFTHQGRSPAGAVFVRQPGLPTLRSRVMDRELKTSPLADSDDMSVEVGSAIFGAAGLYTSKINTALQEEMMRWFFEWYSPHAWKKNWAPGRDCLLHRRMARVTARLDRAADASRCTRPRRQFGTRCVGGARPCFRIGARRGQPCPGRWRDIAGGFNRGRRRPLARHD